ncbi:MAG: PP2C family serine/threonine-protein phosphatase [Actinomycetaceae bacterium]|nr:PP2C family serine/threonine-protein phosphatase [Actinomycetaceae bacterium]MDU0971101.1 PP2C family serine/threonine-protein phosphatase [Actinomycetaceae bacterium]
MKIALNYGARSDQGRVRSSNQDSAYAGPHLLVLADGMGGPAGGDIASTVTVHELRKLDGDSFLATDMGDQLVQAINAAHDQIVSSSLHDATLEGLGTTCTAIIRSGDLLSLAHIGDSRAYRMRDGVLEQQTTDHSFVQYLIQQGQLTPEQAATHPQRSVLLRVLGDTQGRVELDRSTSQAEVGDRWLLCSDGLSGVVPHSELQRILATYADPDMACEKLIEAALAGGGPDNITCIVADIVDEDVATDLPTAPITVGAAAHADANGAHIPVTPDLPTAEIVQTPQAPAQPEPAADLSEDDRATQPIATKPQAAAPSQPSQPQPSQPQPQATPDPVPVAAAPAIDDEDEVDPPKRSHKRVWISLLTTLAIIALLVFAGYRGLAYMRDGWALTIEDNQVVIYNGTPGTVGPVPLYQSRRVLQGYTVVKSSTDCDKIETSHDPKMFVNPEAERVLTCAAERTLTPSLSQPDERTALQWLQRNSSELVVNTESSTASATPTPSSSPATTSPSPEATH